jgi:hypothetical protein
MHLRLPVSTSLLTLFGMNCPQRTPLGEKLAFRSSKRERHTRRVTEGAEVDQNGQASAGAFADHIHALPVRMPLELNVDFAAKN